MTAPAPTDPADGLSPAVRARAAQASVPGRPRPPVAAPPSAGGRGGKTPGREDSPVPADCPSPPGSACVEPAEPGTPGPAGGALDGARGVPAGSTPAVTRLAALPPWPAPPDPGDVLLQIRLGIPPVTESRARVSPAEYTWIGGRKVKTKKAHGYKEAALSEYQETVGWLLRRCRATRNDTDELGVYGIFHLPAGAGAADGDNLLKAITDAGNGIAWKDDRQFTLWLARVVRGSADPHTDLVVYVAGLRTGAA